MNGCKDGVTIKKIWDRLTLGSSCGIVCDIEALCSTPFA